MTVRVAVDAMGGDRGPEEVVAGALEAARDGIVPVVFGPAALDTHGLEHVVATQVVSM
jgi:phosphate acyltransferase